MHTDTLQDNETKKARDEIIHLVPKESEAKGLYIARCGFDCSQRTRKAYGTANCVVCLDMSKNRFQ